MKYCIKCGKKIEDDTAFCPFCGTDQSGKTMQRSSPSQKEKVPLKEKLSISLGTVGFILYYIICLTFCVLPIAVLDFKWYIRWPLLFIVTSTGGGLLETILYIWGLIVVVTSPQNAFSIIYYVFFTLYFLIFILPILLALFNHRKD